MQSPSATVTEQLQQAQTLLASDNETQQELGLKLLVNFTNTVHRDSDQCNASNSTSQHEPALPIPSLSSLASIPASAEHHTSLVDLGASIEDIPVSIIDSVVRLLFSSSQVVTANCTPTEHTETGFVVTG
jgi:hypothetical protein